MFEGLDEDQWQNSLDGEGWPIGVGACHLAEHYANLAQLMMMAASGEPTPDWHLRTLRASIVSADREDK